MFPRWVDSTHVDFRHSFLQPSTDGTSAPLLRSNSWLVAACRRTNAAVQYVCRFQHWFWSVKSVLPISRFSPCSWSGKFLEVETRWSGKFLCSFAFELRSFAFYVWSVAFYVWSVHSPGRAALSSARRACCVPCACTLCSLTNPSTLGGMESCLSMLGVLSLGLLLSRA